MNYVGRFAPSPTGPLHFGSLVAALASWLDARAARGRWLLRIDDLDRAREQPGAVDEILHQLDALGLTWDGDVTYQSRRTERYRAALERLARGGFTYPCGCTRREIADSALGPDGARIYPGTCRAGLPPGKVMRAVRLRTDAEPIRFVDRIQGEIVQSVAHEVGDFVLWRADGMAAYQLAVVVDDADEGITDVVRGADLLVSTPRQIALQHLLGAPTPRYAHVPVVLGRDGEKLSKQTGAAPISADSVSAALRDALVFLGHRAPAELGESELLAWALREWNIGRVPARPAAAPP